MTLALTNLTKQYKPVFTRLAVVRVGLASLVLDDKEMKNWTILLRLKLQLIESYDRATNLRNPTM